MRVIFGLLLIMSASSALAQAPCGPDERFLIVKVPSQMHPPGTSIGAAFMSPTGPIAGEVYFYEAHHPEQKFKFSGAGSGSAPPSRVVTKEDPIPMCIGGPDAGSVDGFAFGVVEPGG
jgi:hypothetical protein